MRRGPGALSADTELRITKTGAGAPAVDPVELDWRQFFGDARLRQLIALALQNNRDLRIAVLAIEQTRAQYNLRRADELPTLNAGLTGSRGPVASGAINSTYTAGLSVTAYELDFFGRVRALSQAAQAQAGNGHGDAP